MDEQQTRWSQWAFVDALGDGVYGVDTAGRCVFVNKAALRILGYDGPGDLIGRNMHETIHHTRPDGSAFPQAECPLLHTSVSGHPVRLDNEMLWRRDGTPFLAEYSSFPVFEGDRVTGSVITFVENSVRQDAQRRLAVQNAVTQVLAGTGAPDEVPRRILETIGTGLGWDLGLFWRREDLSPGRDVLHCIAGWHSRDAGAAAGFAGESFADTLELGAGLPGQVWAMEAPIGVTDLDLSSSSPRQAAAARRGLRSSFAFPITAGGAVVGAIEFFHRQRIELDDSLLEAVATLGQQIGGTLERRRIADALHESERLKGAILAAAPDCVITVDADGRILDFNAAAERTFGTTVAAAIGHDLGGMIFPPEKQDVHRRAFARAKQGDATVLGRRVEIEGVRADGQRFPLELSVTQTAAEPRKLFTVHLRDITLRQQSDARLRQSEARFRTIANAIPQLAWMAEPDGSIAWYNQRWYDYTGTDFADMRGLGWRQLHHPDHLDRVERTLRLSFDTGEPWEDTFPLRAKDGSYGWFLSRAMPIREEPDEDCPNGRIIGWFGTNTDITALRESEEHQAAALAEAEEANRAKSAFLANMSHELRTPLSAIIGYTEMLVEEIEDGAEASELVRDMGKIEGNARHLLGLINDVLDLSKVESGKMEAFAETFDLAGIAGEVAATVQSLMETKSNRLELRLDGALGSMHSDVTRIRQVLLNLLSNAAKFTENGTITLSLAREPGPDGADRVRFEVADTGIGMTEEQLAKLFQRFQQADASTTRKFGGTGLGLALTKAFAVLLGGDVEVRSIAGEGSTFVVQLPATLPQPAPAPEETAEAADETANGDVVLVVDDDETQRQLMSRFLTRMGYVARTAPDGPRGLALARQLRPHAILLDVTMPGMDGWSVLGALKADAELAAIPVVMVTFLDERALASSLGAADYVTKPVNWDRLRLVMDRFRNADGDVLLVDDDADARQRLRQTLERNGWTVAEAANGQEALDRVAQVVPRLILLDLTMPVMDGFEFLLRLRELPGCGNVPVVVLTARDLSAIDRQRLRGANQVLNKGETSPRDLAERLRRLESAYGVSAG